MVPSGLALQRLLYMYEMEIYTREKSLRAVWSCVIHRIDYGFQTNGPFTVLQASIGRTEAEAEAEVFIVLAHLELPT